MLTFLDESIYYIYILCPKNMSESRLYRIICRKRSKDLNYSSEGNVYWRPNSRGYTECIQEAGLYTALELDQCAGNGFDWFAERVVDFKYGDE